MPKSPKVGISHFDALLIQRGVSDLRDVEPRTFGATCLRTVKQIVTEKMKAGLEYKVIGIEPS